MAEFGRENGDADLFMGDDALVLGLASGATVRRAARKAGVAERTAGRRLADPDFRRRVHEARAALFERAIGRLARAATKAADTLAALLDADSESVRLGAARALLELGSKLHESVTLENRIAELERSAAAKGNQAGTGDCLAKLTLEQKLELLERHRAANKLLQEIKPEDGCLRPHIEKSQDLSAGSEPAQRFA